MTRTALVVLGHPAGADQVRNWFSAKGFVADPVIGISFSISGPATLFEQVLGAGDGSALELDQAALRGRVDADVLRYLTAVVVGPPPDFGPGNP